MFSDVRIRWWYIYSLPRTHILLDNMYCLALQLYVLLMCRSTWSYLMKVLITCICRVSVWLTNSYLFMWVLFLCRCQHHVALAIHLCLVEEMGPFLIPMPNVIHIQLVSTLVTVVCECDKWTFTSPFLASCFR